MLLPTTGGVPVLDALFPGRWRKRQAGPLPRLSDGRIALPWRRQDLPAGAGRVCCQEGTLERVTIAVVGEELS